VECAVFATLMVLFAELVLIRIEYKFARKSSESNLYVEYTKAECIQDILKVCREKSIKVTGLEITRLKDDNNDTRYHAVISVHVSHNNSLKDFLNTLATMDSVISVEEL